MDFVFAFSPWGVYLAAIPAVILLGLSKGGFTGLGLLALPLMSLTIPPLQASAILLPIIVIQNGVSAWVYRKHIDRRNVYAVLPGAMVGTLAGYLLATTVPPAAVELGVGVVSIFFGVLQLWPRRRKPDTTVIPANIAMGSVVGFTAGFINLIANAGGPPVLMYLIGQRVARDVLVGTSVFLFTVLNLVRVVPYMALGWFTGNTLFDALLLMPLAIVATWWGVWLVRRTSGPLFYQIAFGMLIVVGLKLTYDGVIDLM